VNAEANLPVEEPPQGAMVARRRLGMDLKAMREARGIPVEVAAKHAQVVRQTLWKIETYQPQVRIKAKDIALLCDLYEARPEVKKALTALAEATQTKGWQASFKDVLPPGFDMYVGLEEYATGIDAYEAELCPGILQTEDYARTVISLPMLLDGGQARTAEEIERRVTLRMRRQDILTRTEPAGPQVTVVLNEAVIRRPVGDTELMAAQLRHINKLGELPNVSIHVLPFSAGMHAGILSGPFSVLSFSTGTPFAYQDGFTELHGGAYYDQPEKVERYTKTFGSLQDSSLGEKASREVVDKAAKEL
jgi:DNA-binding XRE family transcriptional regulator